MADTKETRLPDSQHAPTTDTATESVSPSAADDAKPRPVEIGGRKGPDPTRYGDWEKGGRCIDF